MLRPILLMLATLVAQVTSADSIVRSVTLDELGYRAGLSFESLSGSAQVFIPVAVPEAVIDAQLTLDLIHSATHGARRHLKVRIDGEVARIVDLGATDGDRTLTLPVPLRTMQDGLVAVGLDYSGAATDAVCIDDRAVGDVLRILPNSGLDLIVDGAALTRPTDVMAMMPPTIRLTRPDEPAALAFALRAATRWGGERGHVALGNPEPGPGWAVGHLAVPPGEGPVQVARKGSVPGLIFPATGAQAHLAALSRADGPIRAPGFVPLSRMGFDGTRTDISRRHVFALTIDRGDFAPGLYPTTLELSLIAAPDAGGRGAVVTVLLNGEIIGGRTMRGGRLERLVVDLLRRDMPRTSFLEMIVQREPTGGDCRYDPTAYPVQVLPESGLRVVDGDDAVRTFADLYQAMGDGVEVVLEDAAHLDWAMAAAGATIPDAATIRAVAGVGYLSGNAPFLLVSSTIPAGIEASATRNGARVEVTGSDGTIIHDEAQVREMTVAQIVRIGGQPGLWLRPGSEAPRATPDRPFTLGDGDVALIDASGRTLSLTTHRSDIATLTFPGRRSFTQALGAYRIWVLAVLWLALTAGLLAMVTRIYRRRIAKTPDGTD